MLRISPSPFPEIKSTDLLNLSAILRLNTLTLTNLEYNKQELIIHPIIPSKIYKIKSIKIPSKYLKK
tara:strand:- start:1681 stop:1881 length:201 start_codon:yes stop_codon:yes gene_type:complete